MRGGSWGIIYRRRARCLVALFPACRRNPALLPSAPAPAARSARLQLFLPLSCDWQRAMGMLLAIHHTAAASHAHDPSLRTTTPLLLALGRMPTKEPSSSTYPARSARSARLLGLLSLLSLLVYSVYSVCSVCSACSACSVYSACSVCSPRSVYPI